MKKQIVGCLRNCLDPHGVPGVNFVRFVVDSLLIVCAFAMLGTLRRFFEEVRRPNLFSKDCVADTVVCVSCSHVLRIT